MAEQSNHIIGERLVVLPPHGQYVYDRVSKTYLSGDHAHLAQVNPLRYDVVLPSAGVPATHAVSTTLVLVQRDGSEVIPPQKRNAA